MTGLFWILFRDLLSPFSATDSGCVNVFVLQLLNTPSRQLDDRWSVNISTVFCTCPERSKLLGTEYFPFSVDGWSEILTFFHGHTFLPSADNGFKVPKQVCQQLHGGTAWLFSAVIWGQNTAGRQIFHFACRDDCSDFTSILCAYCCNHLLQKKWNALAVFVSKWIRLCIAGVHFQKPERISLNSSVYVGKLQHVMTRPLQISLRLCGRLWSDSFFNVWSFTCVIFNCNIV